MGYRKNFTKLGNSSALVIDKAIMDLMGMDSKSAVEISIGPDGKSLILRAVQDQEANRQLVEKTRKEIMAEHSEVFRKLADR